MGHLPKRKSIEIWFEDEARIGQKNGIVRQWAKRGTRPRQPADQRYESAYLFGAICPVRGVGAGLAMPYADTHAMQLHLEDPEGSAEPQNQPARRPRRPLRSRPRSRRLAHNRQAQGAEKHFLDPAALKSA